MDICRPKKVDRAVHCSHQHQVPHLSLRVAVSMMQWVFVNTTPEAPPPYRTHSRRPRARRLCEKTERKAPHPSQLPFEVPLP